MKKVLLLGCLSEPSGHLPPVDAVWHCNDSYRVFPFSDFPPELIFQVHDTTKTWGRRWHPTWRRDYLQTAADFVLLHPDPYMPDARVVQYPAHLALDDAPAGTLNCTLSMMLWYAGYLTDVTDVILHGFQLREPEYSICIPGVLRMMDHIRGKGTRVRSVNEKAWRTTLMFQQGESVSTMEYAGIREAAARSFRRTIGGASE